MAALKIIDRGDIPAEKLAGSWAGAFGQTQFMPSSYLRLAVAGSDGKRDIVDSSDAALSSTANYFVKSGWRSGVPWGFEVKLPAGYSGPSGRKAKQSMSFWAGEGGHAHRRPPARGWRRRAPSAGRAIRARLSRHQEFRRRLFLQRRRILLARRLRARRPARGRPGIQTPWPTDDPGLSREGRRELQALLIKRGYDVGAPDGAIGKKTHEAIADFQGKNGMPANGRASQKVLEALKR